MAANHRREYYLQLVNTRTKRPIADDTGSYQVYSAGSPARPSIFNAAGTQLTQEVVGTSYKSQSMAGGVIRFFTTMGVTSCDVSVLTAGGRAYFLKGVTTSLHRIDVDPDQTEFTLVAAINDKASNTTIRPIGFQLRRGMAIKDVYVKVVTAFAGAATGNNKFLFGRSGAASGFAKLLNISSVGFKQATAISSTGTIVAGQIIGSDLRTMKTGNATNFGWLVPKKYWWLQALQTTTWSSSVTPHLLLRLRLGLAKGTFSIRTRCFSPIRRRTTPNRSL